MARPCGTELYEAFVTVVDVGGFTAAAERLHCSQTTVSQRVRRFEELLGRRLFRRSTRVVELTPAGEALLPCAQYLLRLHKEAVDVVTGAEPEALRFGVPDRYAEFVMPLVVKTAWHDTGTDPVVACHRSPVLAEMVQQGRLDAAMLTRCPGTPAGRFVARERMVWAGHPDFRWSEDKPLPLAVAPENCPYRCLALGALEEKNVPYAVVHTGENGWALEQAVQQRRAVMPIPAPRIGQGLLDVGAALGLPEPGHADIELHLGELTAERLGSEFEEVLVDRLAQALAET